MMLFKLAIKNVKTQFRYYFMYFMSMAFSVMVYYSFVSMSYDKTLVNRAATDLRIDAGLRAGSVMIILFIIVFMFSANAFFVKRRKREIGLYSLLGMRRSQVGILFFVENMFLGLIALVTGIFFGVIFSKLFAMLLLKSLQVPVASGFIFSFQAVLDTMIVFLVILGIVSIRTATTVYRYKLITLFKADEQGEGSNYTRWYNWVLGILGVGLLGTGYYLAANFYHFLVWLELTYKLGGFGMLIGPLLILLICVIGTYLFFSHFLGIVLRLIQQAKRYYYKDINMITTGNLSFHLKKNARAFATIAVLSGTALAAIGGAASVQSFTLGLAHSANPTTYAITEPYSQEFHQFLKDQDAVIESKNKLEFKYVGGQFGFKTDQTYTNEAHFYNVISLSNYQKAQDVIKEIEPINLTSEKDVAMLGGTNKMYVEKMITYDETGVLGNIGEVRIADAKVDYLGNARDMRLNGAAVVVTDKLYEQLKASYTYNYEIINVKDGDRNASLSEATTKKYGELIDQTHAFVATTTLEEGKMTDTFKPLPEPLKENFPVGYLTQHDLSVRYPYYNSLMKNTGLLIYVAVFLGMVFMIATGSIITLKQLSEAEDEALRYDMLRKIGTPKQLIKKSIYKQNFTVFFVPLFVSLLHAYFALQVLFVLIEVPSLLLTFISVAFLIVIYVLFYFATSSSYNKIVNS
ncbi:ABC transporter permease [Vagococcus sp. DIV0080]|uniref:ABC transporter permease n=1 Tax=Candidatus Vagococcus giribetii TaxID=2230876 RepID=A0ABS3HNW9_9ENTE|nr:ABC transporter permease [Vagococcus sp. DIV0080]MBO0475441.1 ABC transporter permease [Vagococcus sp. DIV0080]